MPRSRASVRVRYGFFESIDWRFTAIAALSFLAHAAFVLTAESADDQVEQDVSVISEAAARLVFKEPELPRDASERSGGGDRIPETSASPRRGASSHTRSAPAAKEARKTSEAPTRVEAPRGARVVGAAERAVSLLLTALARSGADDAEAIADVLRTGAVTSDAADVLQRATATRSTVAEGESMRFRSAGYENEARRSDPFVLESLRRDTRAAIEGAELVERRPPSEPSSGGAGLEPAAVVCGDVDWLGEGLRGRLPTIRACYERLLRERPTLAGKVTVRLTIEPNGTLSNVSMVSNTSDDDALARCVVEPLSRLRLSQGPLGGVVSYSFPFVFAPSP